MREVQFPAWALHLPTIRSLVGRALGAAPGSLFEEDEAWHTWRVLPPSNHNDQTCAIAGPVVRVAIPSHPANTTYDELLVTLEEYSISHCRMLRNDLGYTHHYSVLLAVDWQQQEYTNEGLPTADSIGRVQDWLRLPVAEQERVERPFGFEWLVDQVQPGYTLRPDLADGVAGKWRALATALTADDWGVPRSDLREILPRCGALPTAADGDAYWRVLLALVQAEKTTNTRALLDRGLLPTVEQEAEAVTRLQAAIAQETGEAWNGQSNTRTLWATARARAAVDAVLVDAGLAP